MSLRGHDDAAVRRLHGAVRDLVGEHVEGRGAAAVAAGRVLRAGARRRPGDACRPGDDDGRPSRPRPSRRCRRCARCRRRQDATSAEGRPPSAAKQAEPGGAGLPGAQAPHRQARRKDAGLGGKVSTTVSAARPGGPAAHRQACSSTPGSAAINAAAPASTLDKIGGIIADERKHPVVVEGHTDDQPIATSQYPSNWELSGARAGAVVSDFARTACSPSGMSLGGYAARASRRQQRDARRPRAEPPGRDRPDPAAWSQLSRKEATTMNKKMHHHRRGRAARRLGGAYKFVLAKPAKARAEAEGRGHGLRAPEGVPRQPRRRPLREAAGRRSCSPRRHVAAAAGGHGAATPPEGYGAMSPGGRRPRHHHRRPDRRDRRRPDRPRGPREAQEEDPQGRSRSTPMSRSRTSCSPTSPSSRETDHGRDRRLRPLRDHHGRPAGRPRRAGTPASSSACTTCRSSSPSRSAART